jgi:hypothetical protein
MREMQMTVFAENGSNRGAQAFRWAVLDAAGFPAVALQFCLAAGFSADESMFFLTALAGAIAGAVFGLLTTLLASRGRAGQTLARLLQGGFSAVLLCAILFSLALYFALQTEGPTGSAGADTPLPKVKIRIAGRSTEP